MRYRKEQPISTFAVLATGQVARACGVSDRTVRVWLAAGRIPGAWRLPTSGRDWRVPRAALAAFLEAEGIPPGELAGVPRRSIREVAR